MTRRDYAIIGGAGAVSAHLDEIREYAAGCRMAASAIVRANNNLGVALEDLTQTRFLQSGAGWGHAGTYHEARRADLRELRRVRTELNDLAEAARATIRAYQGAEQYGKGLFALTGPIAAGFWLECLTTALLPLAPHLGAGMRAIDNPAYDVTLTEEKNPPKSGPVRSMADAVERTGLRHTDSSDQADDNYRIQIDKVVQPDGTVAWQVFLPGMQALGANHHPVDIPHVLAAVMGTESDATRAIDDILQQAGVKEGEAVMLAGHSAGGMAVAAFAGSKAAAKYNITSVLTAGSPVRLMGTPKPHTQVLHLEHQDDFIVHLDGGATVPGENRTIVRGLSSPAPETDPPNDQEGIAERIGDPHRTARYRELAKQVDNHGAEPSLDAFKAAMALTTPKAAAQVTTREFVLRLENKPLTPRPTPQPQPRTKTRARRTVPK